MATSVSTEEVGSKDLNMLTLLTLEQRIDALQRELDAARKAVSGEKTEHVWAHFRHENSTEDISAGVRAETLEEAWDKFMTGAKYANEKYGIVMTGSPKVEREPSGAPTEEPQYVEVGSDIVVGPTPSVTTVVRSPNQPAEHGRYSPEGMPLNEEDQVHGTIYRFTCVMFVVTPQPIDAKGVSKSKVELFGNLFGNAGGVDKYAYVTVWGTPAQLASTFATVGQWPESTFMTAKKFQLTNPFYVNWVLSDRKNTAGRYFRNLSSLMPIV